MLMETLMETLERESLATRKKKKKASAKEKLRLTWVYKLIIYLLSSFVCNVLLGIKRTSLPYLIHPPQSISNSFFVYLS